MSGVPCGSVETGTKNRCVIEATHVLRRNKRKKGKIKLVHEFFRLKSSITLEQVNSTEWSKKKNKNLN